MIAAPHTSKKGYFYSIDSDDDGEVFVEIREETEGTHNVWVSKVDGDTTMTFVVKTDCKKEGEESKVMVWHSKGECKHKGHDGEHRMIISKSVDVEVETEDGDSVITYTIKVDGEDGKSENVMIWTSEGDEKMMHDIMLKEIDGDSCKMIIVTTGDDGEMKIIKKKEMIIITEKDDHDHEHDKDKDKKKDKKKDKDKNK